MPKNHKAKVAQKTYLADHPGASRREARDRTQKASKPRRRQAKKVLHASGGGLVDALAPHFEVAPVTGPGSREVLEEMLRLLDDVSPRPHPLSSDIRDALKRRITLDDAEVIPSIPPGVQHAAAGIEALVSGLEDRQLVVLATDLKVTCHDADYAVFLAATRSKRMRRAARESALRWTDDAEKESSRAVEAAEHERFRKRVIAHLQDLSGTAWGDEDREVLRAAVSLRLAELADAYLTATEEPTPPDLLWREYADGTLRADFAITDVAQPLSALVSEAHRHQGDAISSAEFYRPTRARTTIGYTCYVGAIDRSKAGTALHDPRDSGFDMISVSGPHNLFGAKLAGARMIGAIAANPDIVRSYSEHRLLVPRSARPAVDESTLACDLTDVLGVMAGETEYVGETEWVPWPHIVEGSDLRLSSITALVLDACGLPCPRPGDPANGASVVSLTFRKFLATQGVRISELARTYLAGAENAGTGELSLQVRHAAGLVAVEGRHGLRAVVGELARRYPRVEETILELGDRESVIQQLAAPEALSEFLERSE